MDIRMITTDLDSTLLDSTKKVSQHTVDVLKACEAKGVLVVLTSGRNFESVSTLAKTIGLTSPVISCNGAQVDLCPEGDTIFTDCFPSGLAERVCRIAEESGLAYSYYKPGSWYKMHHERFHADRRVSRIVRVGDRNTELRYTTSDVSDYDAAVQDGYERIMKFLMFSQNASDLEKMTRIITEETSCQVSSSNYDNIEIMVPGGGKGRGIACLRGRLGIEKDQIMAFGDHLNDIDMMGAVGWPVVMENGLDVVKRLAWKIAPSCDEDGVARMLEKYVLEDRK